MNFEPIDMVQDESNVKHRNFYWRFSQKFVFWINWTNFNSNWLMIPLLENHLRDFYEIYWEILLTCNSTAVHPWPCEPSSPPSAFPAAIPDTDWGPESEALTTHWTTRSATRVADWRANSPEVEPAEPSSKLSSSLLEEEEEVARVVEAAAGMAGQHWA